VAPAAVITMDVEGATLERVLRLIAQQAGLRLYFQGDQVLPSTRVTMHVRAMPVSDALVKALAGTALRASIISNIVVLSPIGEDIRSMMQGSITGTVVDATTKRPVRGATVILDQADRGVVTGNEGTFRLTNLSPGRHTLRVRMLGYVRVTREIAVTDGETRVMTVALEPNANPLEQVVVTGTVIPTALKAVPNAITVITSAQLEQRGITRLDQLFRGDVPGLYAEKQNSGNPLDSVGMYSRGATALTGTSAGTDGRTNPIKTYVDGVELANPWYLSQLDPKSIERIEILTGPQASTIYGSNALNGVMQIFTKRGTTTRPQVTLDFSNGWLQNNFSSALAPVHNYTAQANGLEGRLSYNLGGSWDFTGRWTPASRATRMGGFGGVRFEALSPGGRITTDLTGRRQSTQNVKNGPANQPLVQLGQVGLRKYVIASPGRTIGGLTGQTFGLTVGYAPTAWWSHDLQLGDDFEDTQSLISRARYTTPRDTNVFLTQGHSDRRSLRYSSTVRVPVAPRAQATVTGGADGWQSLTVSSNLASTKALSGTGLSSFVNAYARQPLHNAGGFLQAQLALFEQVFLTYGVRGEWNPAIGKDLTPAVSPTMGISMTRDVGPVTVKLRATYGRSTRPPGLGFKEALTIDQERGAGSQANDPAFSQWAPGLLVRVANPALSPETQQGGEGGVELYLGSRASLVITRYNQTVDNLIANVGAVDTIPSLTIDPAGWCENASLLCDQDGHGLWLAEKYVNMGSIRNQGWEVQGSVTTGPFTTRGTYSWTKSRVLGVTPLYKQLLGENTAYTPGQTFNDLPEHTWAVTTTYAVGRTTASVHVDGIGKASGCYAFCSGIKNPIGKGLRLWANQSTGVLVNPGLEFRPGYATVDVGAVQHLTPRMDGVLHVSNLANRYDIDSNVLAAVLGRQTRLGLRIRW